MSARIWWWNFLKEEAMKLQFDIDIDSLILSRVLHFTELTANDLRT